MIAPLRFCLISQVDAVTDAHLARMVRAFTIHGAACALAYGTPEAAPIFSWSATTCPDGASAIVFVAHLDVSGAAAYHDEIGGIAQARVGTGLGTTRTDWELGASHEALEAWGDPLCDQWEPQPDGTSIARELCDPIEDEACPISIDGELVACSDYVLPAWFVPGSAGPWDALGKLTGPVSLDPSGVGVTVTANSLTSGHGLEVDSSSITSGTGLYMNFSGTQQTSPLGERIVMAGGTTAGSTLGMWIQARNAGTNNTAAEFDADGASTGTNTALLLTASGATTANTALRIINGDYSQANGNFDMSGSAGTFATSSGAVTFTGRGTCTPTLVSGVLTCASDARLKVVDAPFARGLAAVVGLRPTNFHWNELSGLDPTEQQTGFIAQEVERVIPEAVGRNAQGMRTLIDRPIVAALVNGERELSDEILECRADVRDLRVELAREQQESERLRQDVRDLRQEVEELRAMVLAMAPIHGIVPARMNREHAIQ